MSPFKPKANTPKANQLKTGPAQQSSSMHLLHQQPITTLKGVGQQLALRLEKLGLYSLQDALFYLPYRYIDRTRIIPIAHLTPLQPAVIEGDIEASNVSYGKRRSLICSLKDDTGVINLRFYHFSVSQKNALAHGQRLRCFGEVRPGASGLELYHPEYQLIDSQNPAPLEQTLTPPEVFQ